MFSFRDVVLNINDGKVHLFSAGQAGFILKSVSGRLLAIDLYLSDYLERLCKNAGTKRLLPKILAPTDLKFDCIVATHSHPDHFDNDSMADLMHGGVTSLFCSQKCVKNVNAVGIENSLVTYVNPGDRVEVEDFVLHFVNCDHGTGAPDAVGVIVETGGVRICEVGDTCLRMDRVQEYNQFGKLDVLIGPINGAYGNMNEYDFAKLSGAIQPVITIPCHYGMFASHGGNPGLFLNIMKKEYPRNEVQIMGFGEEMTVGKRSFFAKILNT